MTTFQHIRGKITEALSDLYEAFFAAQESLEENEYVASVRRMTKPLSRRSATLRNCEPRVS